MKTTSTKKLAALFSLAVLGFYGIVIACADMDWGYDYDSSFTPEVYVDESYTPLFFAPRDVFYDIVFEDKYTTRFNDEVVAEWVTYLKGSTLTDVQIQEMLLNDDAKKDVTDAYNAIQKK